MPREFFTDFVKVAQDEGRHFTLLAKRLEELGSSYGALPAHDGLWDSAIATSKDLLARLAIEHCVHEVHACLFFHLLSALFEDFFFFLISTVAKTILQNSTPRNLSVKIAKFIETCMC